MNSVIRKKGFGLLEVLLAGVIIITVLGALIVLAKGIINNTTYNQQRTEALFLAEQGIEIVRQIRDTNYIDGKASTDWNTFISGPLADPDSAGPEDPDSKPELEVAYRVCRTYSNSIMQTDLRRLVLVKEDDPRCRYGSTFYQRTVTFSDVGSEIFTVPNSGVEAPNKNGYKVEVTVKWDFLSHQRELKISEIIANSRQGW